MVFAQLSVQAVLVKPKLSVQAVPAKSKLGYCLSDMLLLVSGSVQCIVPQVCLIPPSIYSHHFSLLISDQNLIKQHPINCSN